MLIITSAVSFQIVNNLMRCDCDTLELTFIEINFGGVRKRTSAEGLMKVQKSFKGKKTIGLWWRS